MKDLFFCAEYFLENCQNGHAECSETEAGWIQGVCLRPKARPDVTPGSFITSCTLIGYFIFAFYFPEHIITKKETEILMSSNKVITLSWCIKIMVAGGFAPNRVRTVRVSEYTSRVRSQVRLLSRIFLVL